MECLKQFDYFLSVAFVTDCKVSRAVLYFCRCNHILGFQIILHPVCLLKCHSVLYSVGTDSAFNLMLDYKFHVYFPSFPAFFLPCLPRSDSLAVVRLLLILLQLVKTPAVLTTGVLIFPYIFIIITKIFMLVLLELPCCLT